MASDLEIFFEQLQKLLGAQAFKLGQLIIAVSFLEFIAVFFLITVINKFTNTRRNIELERAPSINPNNPDTFEIKDIEEKLI
jgi:hypothetical protein